MNLLKSIVGFPLYHQVPAAWFSQWLRLDHTHVAATITVNGAYITTAMETIVEKALGLETDWDRLVIFEHDVIPPVEAFTRIAHYKPEYDVVGSMYFGHDPPHTAFVYIEHPDGSTDPITPDTVSNWCATPALYRCDAVGFGFTSIARHVLEKWDKDVPMFHLGEGYGSHDLWFCREARKQGFGVYVDSGLCCDHLSQVAVGLTNNQECAPMIDGTKILDFSYAEP